MLAMLTVETQTRNRGDTKKPLSPKATLASFVGLGVLSFV
jgi:hypothetical protein